MPLRKGVGRPWAEEIPRKRWAGEIVPDLNWWNVLPPPACQTLLARVLDLHAAGHSAEEIARQVLTTEPENAIFRAAMLVEIILQYARGAREEETP